MKKVIRLTESDLERIIKKVINEQSTKPKGFFEKEFGNVSSAKTYVKNEDEVDTAAFKMPEYFKPYIGLVVSETDFTKKIDDIAFGGGKPILKIGDLRPAYIDSKGYDPQHHGFQGVRAQVNIGNRSGSQFFYYDCKEKQWKYEDFGGDNNLMDKSLFNQKFFDLGDFIQSKFCNSYITKPRLEQA
jgi:hypothetical protein